MSENSGRVLLNFMKRFITAGCAIIFLMMKYAVSVMTISVTDR